MRILIWHLHGSWMTSFVQGRHDYLVPVLDDRSAFGRGRASSWDWPDRVVEVPPARLRDAELDAVVVQRPEEMDLCERWTGRRPGRDVPAVWLEHNAPQGAVNDLRHPAADVDGMLVVHVTHFNRLFWDCGTTPTVVIEHGIPDPGYRYTGELDRAAVVINEPIRRGRVVGTDLLPGLAAQVPVDLFGLESAAVQVPGVTPAELSQAKLHGAMAQCRLYLHPYRWTSLGLALVEAMMLGLPVAALATTGAAELPPDVGVVSNRVDELGSAIARWRGDLEEAKRVGKNAREVALERFGLERFLTDWDRTLEEWMS